MNSSGSFAGQGLPDSTTSNEAAQNAVPTAAEVLRRSQEKLVGLIQSVEGIVWEADVSTFAFTYVSPRAERLLGYPVARWIENPTFWSDHLHPEDREAAVKYCHKETSEGRDHEFEYRFMAADGRVVWLRDIVTVVFENGAPATLRGIMVDITAQKRAERDKEEVLAWLRRSEERFRELAETIEDVFWVSTPDKQQMLYVSPGYETIWGRPCQDLYRHSRSWIEAVHPDDRQRVQHAVLTRQALGSYDEVFRIIKPNGDIRWIRDRAYPVRDAQGQVERIVGVARDITEHRALQEQVFQAQKLEAIGKLAGGIAHDFNNVLAAILGHADLALDERQPREQIEGGVREIRKAALRGKELVQRILAFSRQHVQQRRVVQLEPLVEEAIGFLRATIPAGVELRMHVATNLPPVFADATQMHQVIVNLCTNAWQALDDERGIIDIAVDAVTLAPIGTGPLQSAGPRQFVRLTVTDNGSGIAETIIDRIFEPFFTTKSVARGTGLGLSVVHGIVQEHGGTITVKSVQGQGATFEIHLPAALETQGAVAPSSSKPVQRGSGEHILFLDDEESLVFLAKRTLEGLGYRVSGFTSAESALDAYRDPTQAFDLAITDLNMPGSSGLQVAKELLQLRPEIPVVLSSGYVTEELRLRAVQFGICDVLYKPNTMLEMSEVIHSMIVRARGDRVANDLADSRVVLSASRGPSMIPPT